MRLEWYFDFISPFAYLQHCQFERLPADVEVVYKPILFAGLLNHWENVGPAEIPPKRTFTYKHCHWKAKSLNIPFKMPPAHPFNSLLALRLAIATNCQKESIQTIFEAIWKHGLDLNSIECADHLERILNIENLAKLVSQQNVKDQLRVNTEHAAERNVFGVPTFAPEGDSHDIFWGYDSFDMLLDYLENPSAFRDDEMIRIESLPEGVQRKR